MIDTEKIILKYMFDNYSAKDVVLNHVFLQELNFSNSDLKQASEAIGILSVLAEHGYIKYEPNKNSDDTYPVGEYWEGYGRKPGTLENHTIKGRLTLRGKDYIENFLRQDTQDALLAKQTLSIIETNKSVTKYSNSNQWTPYIAGLAALISIIGLIRDVVKSQPPDTATPQILKKQAQSLDSIWQYQKEVNSSLKNLNDSLVKYLKKSH